LRIDGDDVAVTARGVQAPVVESQTAAVAAAAATAAK